MSPTSCRSDLQVANGWKIRDLEATPVDAGG
jgi:hypothetical protein